MYNVEELESRGMGTGMRMGEGEFGCCISGVREESGDGRVNAKGGGLTIVDLGKGSIKERYLKRRILWR